MTITEKDKKLLALGGILLAVVFLILFVIKPGFTGFGENNAKIETLKTQKATMKTEIDALPTYEANLKTAVSEYNATAATIYGDLTADKVQDTLIADFISKHSLSATALSMAKPSYYSISRFTVETNDFGEVIANNGATSTADGAIKLVPVTLTVGGSSENIVSMIDSMNGTPGIFVQQVTYASADGTSTANISLLMALSETFA